MLVVTKVTWVNIRGNFVLSTRSVGMPSQRRLLCHIIVQLQPLSDGFIIWLRILVVNSLFVEISEFLKTQFIVFGRNPASFVSILKRTFHECLRFCIARLFIEIGKFFEAQEIVLVLVGHLED